MISSSSMNTDINELSEFDTQSNVASLAQLWAKRYMRNLDQAETSQQHSEHSSQQHSGGSGISSGEFSSLQETLSPSSRRATGAKIQNSLRFTSAQAWAKTETLLISQVERHQIATDLIDPWQVATDARFIFEEVMGIYAQQGKERTVSLGGHIEQLTATNTAGESQAVRTVTTMPSPEKLAVLIASSVGEMRYRYTKDDPRVLGFVSMQLHYTGQMLLDVLSPWEKVLVGSYFKVIDDNLYMPLQRAYQAAAKLDYHDPALEAVRALLPITSELARYVAHNAALMHPDYHSISGALTSPTVRVSSIRDVEMFQVYLCLSVLEASVQSIQEELFPLCVMLYPPLKVNWSLVRSLLRLLGHGINKSLAPEVSRKFRPYLRALWEMFNTDVFPEA
ncbi:MAG: hypothetical protein ACK456_10005 [Pseudanabaenaceae cyanobacterium]|jgi:hypothetical protein